VRRMRRAGKLARIRKEMRAIFMGKHEERLPTRQNTLQIETITSQRIFNTMGGRQSNLYV